MSNRAQRRSDTRAFRREVHRDHILTYLVDVNADLDTYPLLSRAVSYWRGNIQQRRPFCPACRANFADDAEVAMFLLATPTIAPTSASVSAFCTKCWHDLPPEVIEREAARVLRHLIPNGRFIDHQGTRR